MTSAPDEGRTPRASPTSPTLRTLPTLPTLIDDEPDGRADAQEVRRLLRRAAARPLVTVGVAALLALVVVALRARGGEGYTSQIVFRVTESDLEAGTAPPPNRELRGYVRDVAFASRRLLGVIVQRGLYPAQMARDPERAVEAMRADIGVEVYRNYFLLDREPDDPPRSARIAVSFRAADPELAYEVVHELGHLIVEESVAERVAEVERATADAADASRQIRDELERKNDLLVRAELASRGGRTPARDLELADLKLAVSRLESQLGLRVKSETELRLRGAMEKGRIGLAFDLVDGGRAARRARPRLVELAATGLGAFLGLSVLIALLIGAFDPRVDDDDDVRRLGLVALGTISDRRR